MNKKLFITTVSALLLSFSGKAQFNFSDLQHFIGSGSDTAMLVVDFRDGTPDSSLAFGYVFSGSKTGEDMLNAVAAADVNFSVNISGGFLNDIVYGQHEGIGGSPDFWSTWDGQDTASLSTNMGISTPVQNGDWFALSYTDFTPSADKPGLPKPAFDPKAFTLSDVKTWVGSGSDSAVIVIDFLDGSRSASFAWGYLFNDSAKASTVLADLASSESDLTVNAGQFLNDIIYKSDSGSGGAPNFWATWSGTNPGNWYLNAGIATYVKSGDFFGCTYTDFSPALRPNVPTAVDNDVSIETVAQYEVNVFPNPASEAISLKGTEGKSLTVSLTTADGKQMLRRQVKAGQKLDVSDLPRGMYLIEVNGESQPLLLN